MSARKRSLRIPVEHSARSAWFYGPARIISPAVRIVGCPSQWDNRRHALSVPIQSAADVEALLTANGHIIELRMVTG